MNTPAVHSWDLRLTAGIFATGWRAALQRGVQVKCEAWQLASSAPRVVSLRPRRQRVRVASYVFPDSGLSSSTAANVLEPKAAVNRPIPQPTATRPSMPATSAGTRIKPPQDIIRLQDRLYYLLQPPLENLCRSGALHFPFQPFPYQYQGVAFLFPRYSAVLADEMGLGKTMQAITSIRLLVRTGEVRSVLLVCPKPLLTNWLREFKLWAPEVPVQVIEGDQARRQWLWNQPGAVVKIANYEVMIRDENWLTGGQLHFDLMLLDEAQRVKNRSSATSRIARSISRSRAWALTGTPVENSTEDLVGIFEFLSPGFLNPAMSPRHMGQTVRDYILRRTKSQVLTEMPPKLFRDSEVNLAPSQWETYQRAQDEGVLRLAGMGEEVTIQHVFELVLRLKQICNFDPVTGDSAKLEQLEADLEEVAASGQKAIIFSQWVKTLDRLGEHLQRFGPLAYHGKVPSNRRDQVLDQFRNDPRKHVILMSYGAGSVGLNLQFASYVFLFDRWWNPAVEDQAINRAHRIGAAGPVTVSRMLTVGTIEERIHQVLEEKRQLIDAIFSESGGPGNLGLTQEEIFGLFDLRCPK